MPALSAIILAALSDIFIIHATGAGINGNIGNFFHFFRRTYITAKAPKFIKQSLGNRGIDNQRLFGWAFSAIIKSFRNNNIRS